MLPLVFNSEQQRKKDDANKTLVFGSDIGISWRTVTWREVSHDWERSNVLTLRRKNISKQIALGWNIRKTVKDRASHLLEREEHLMNEEVQGLPWTWAISPHPEPQVNDSGESAASLLGWSRTLIIILGKSWKTAPSSWNLVMLPSLMWFLVSPCVPRTSLTTLFFLDHFGGGDLRKMVAVGVI